MAGSRRSFNPSDPSILAYASYVRFLAQSITAAGLNSRVPPAIQGLLAGGTTGEPVDAHAIQPYYTGLLARACGLNATIAAEGETIVVVAS